MIKDYSETLIQQLALRDELEYEKELKNSFISLLLSVQNKRRQFNLEKKKRGKAIGPNGIECKVALGPTFQYVNLMLFMSLTLLDSVFDNGDSLSKPTRDSKQPDFADSNQK